LKENTSLPNQQDEAMNAQRRCCFAISSEDILKLGSLAPLKRDHVPRQYGQLDRSGNSSRREAAT
jgi:hypothetical protein